METLSRRPLDTIWGSHTVNQYSFGDVFTTFTTLKNFSIESSCYSGGIMRWPGGSLSEDKSSANKFDLTYPNLYSSDSSGGNDNGKGFSTILEYANTHNQHLSMILPVLDYYKLASTGGASQTEAISKQTSDISLFLDRLSNFHDGYYDEAKQLLDRNTITFEIGNEVDHLGWKNGVYDDQLNYGAFAYGAIEALKGNDRAHDLLATDHLEIGVLTGLNAGSAQNIIAELDGSKSGHESVLDDIDKLISHWGLRSNAQGTMLLDDGYSDGCSYDEHVKTLLRWKEALGNHWTDVTLYASEWGVGRSGFDAWNFPSDATDNPYTYVDPSALSATARAELAINDIGARQGAGTIDVYSQLISLGFSETSLWGTVDPAINSSSYHSIWGSTAPWHSASGIAPLSHGGEVLHIMSEDILGKTLLEGNVDVHDGTYEWNSHYFDWDTRMGAGEVNKYAFGNNEEITIFLTVTDIDGYLCTNSGELEYSVDLSKFGGLARTANIQTVGTTFMLDEWRDFRTSALEPLDISSTDEYLYRRLFEAPEVTQSTVDLSGTALTYTFHSDFEVVCITIDRQISKNINGWMLGTPSEDVINGTSSSDSIRTYASNDSIHSGLGSDIVFAGSGHDSIYGDAGNDLLIGRAGNDYINGGLGNDKLRGGRGSDILVGEDGADRLVGHGGNDTLIGGHGHDILKGGDGSDTFVFTEDFGADKIRDFDTSADGDVLDFSEVVDDYSQLSIESSHLGMNTQISVIGSDDYVVLVGISPDMINLDQHILL